MDPSLAKGLKNQFFREISHEIDDVIKQWINYCKESKLDSSRAKWEKFCEGIDEVFGPFLLAKYKGGSKRKPYLCMATFENESRKYNSWSESCIFSRLLYITNNPVWVESLPMAFSVSEHAIQRIFERSLTDESPLDKNFRKIHFSRELRHAPLWAIFWVCKTNARFEYENNETFKIIIPSPSGLFLGEIHKNSYCEIRTYVAKSQFSSPQKNLHAKMLDVSENFSDSVIPFLFHKFISDQSGSADELINFLMASDEISILLKTEFQIEI